MTNRKKERVTRYRCEKLFPAYLIYLWWGNTIAFVNPMTHHSRVLILQGREISDRNKKDRIQMHTNNSDEESARQVPHLDNHSFSRNSFASFCLDLVLEIEWSLNFEERRTRQWIYSIYPYRDWIWIGSDKLIKNIFEKKKYLKIWTSLFVLKLFFLPLKYTFAWVSLA